MAGYVRQSTADIIPTATVRAAPINAEYNALRDAFAASGGHKHDGTSGEGEYVPLIADLDALNKVIIDTTNNRVGVFVEVSAAAVEQIRIQDGVIVPVTDNDIDLGTSSVEFKDLYLDGTAYIDTLAVHESATITSNFSVNGNTTLGNAASDTVTFTADVASSILPSADDTYDLGSSASQWRNLYIDGTANIDSLVADTADINGGTLDGVTIGGSTAAAADFTTMDASGNATVGGTLGVTGATTLSSTLTVTGATALNGGLTLDTNKFTVADTTGNTAIAGTLDVTGATALASTLDVTGATTVADFTATGTTVLPATSFGDANITNVGNIALDSITADGSSITITGNTTFADGAYDFDIASHDTSNGLKLAGTLVTATATELNYNDTGSSVGTVVASKTVTVDGNKDVSSFRNLTATGDITTGNLVISDGGNIGSASDTNAISIASDGDVTVSQSMTVTGDLTVNGSTNTISTTNTVIEDALIELGAGTTGTPSNDAGIVIERGDSNNAFIGFDESEDKFKVGTGTFTGSDTGNLTITTGTLVANIEGNLTGTVTGNASGLTGMNTAISELNIMDGDTSATSTTLEDADRVVVNDAGTMKQVALTDFETYFESALDTLSNVTTVGTLNSGSITSGFGSIDNGSSAITTTGTITFGTLSDGSDSVTDIVTSVGSGSANSELPTALAVENRIQAVSAISNNVTGLNATGAELNAVADVSAITIDTSTAIANNDGIAVFDSSASAIGYFDVDLLDTYFAGTTKTLTNKTITSPTVSGLYLSDAGFIVEGSSADGNETTVTFTDPTADRTITFPNATGTVALSGATQNVDFGTITADGINSSGNFAFTAADGMQISAKESISINIDSDDNDSSRAFTVISGSSGSTESLIVASEDAGVSLYYDNASKLATTATGIDVTGTVTLDDTLNISGGSTTGFLQASGTSLQLGASTASNLIAYTNNSERMRIDSSGNLLLGTSAHAGYGPLQVGSTSTASTIIQMLAATNGYNTIHFGDATSGTGRYAGYVQYNHTDDKLFLGAGGATRATIDSSGNVGIGTSSPIYPLHVKSSATTTAVFDAGSDGYDVQLRMEQNGTFVGAVGYDDSLDAVYLNRYGNATQGLTVVSGGNVGIGTSSPSTKLEIDQGSSSTASFKITGSSSPGMRIVESSGVTAHFANDSAAVYIGSSTNHPFVLRTNNTERMRIDTSGNLIVGNTTDGAASSITLQHDGDIRGVLASGAGGDSLISAISGVSNGYQITVDGSNNQTYKWYNGGTQSMTLDSSGNLLVGTTNSDVGGSTTGIRLSQNGSLYSSTDETDAIGNGPFYGDRRGTNNVGDILTLGLGGFIKASIGVLGTNSVSDNGGITFNTISANTTKTERMRITSTGNVGIGTDSPSQSIDTTGKVRIRDGGNTTIPSLQMGSTGVDGFALPATNTLGFITNSAERMRIDSSGNVGIGTSSPSYKLQVADTTDVDINLVAGKNSGDFASIVFGDTDYGAEGRITYQNFDDAMRFWANRINAMIIDNSGNLIIASTGGTLQTATAGTSNFRAGVNAGNSIASGGNYNTVVGDEAGTAITTGDNNTLIGYVAGDAIITSSGNTAVGSFAMTSMTDGADNVAVGTSALDVDTKGSKSVAVGRNALGGQNFTTATDTYNVAVGYDAGKAVTTGTQNTFVGGLAGDGTDDGNYNTAVGRSALSGNCGDSNTVMGYQAAVATTGAGNTCIGTEAGLALTSGSNCVLIGKNAGRTGSPGGNLTSGNNDLVLGDGNISAANIQVDWTVASDQRDKTDFTALDLGLDFVKALAPVTYKWDKRSKYGDKSAEDYDLNAQTPDGTHKEDWLDVGFKAQEVEALEKAAGYKIADKTNLTTTLSSDGKQYGMQYSKFVPILVKAIQELSAKNDALEARIATLEG